MSAKELNIGDYVKQKRGHIYKIKSKGQLEAQQYRNEANDKENEGFIAIKTSPDIIDLIEVGDIVNNRMVEQKYIDLKGKTTILIYISYNRFMKLYEKDIKSVVTREQIEQLKYKIGE